MRQTLCRHELPRRLGRAALCSISVSVVVFHLCVQVDQVQNIIEVVKQ